VITAIIAAVAGKKRTQTFSVDSLEPGSKGALVHGRAYVQFCLTEGEGNLVIYETGFRWVHRTPVVAT
jgi:hypothetical protein